MTDRTRNSCGKTRAATTRPDQGFSLVELMVVLVVLAIGLLPLAFVQTRAQQEVVDSGRQSEAVALAQLQMETAKSQGFGVAVDANGAVGNYTWTQTVTNVSFGLDQITVTVNWSERGQPRSVSMINRVSMR